MDNVWITTKGGDKGETSIGSGDRLPKDHPRVETYGTLDECQAHIGMARSLCEYPDICDRLCKLEQDLGKLMGYIALYPGLSCPDIGELERITEIVGNVTGKTFRFVRPGDSTPGAALHVARTVARRAERIAVKFTERESWQKTHTGTLTGFPMLFMRFPCGTTTLNGKKTEKNRPVPEYRTFESTSHAV